MKKFKYKNEKKKEIQKKIIIIVMILVVILIASLIILDSFKHVAQKQKQVMIEGKLDTVEDVINYYGCKFIKLVESKEDGFSSDIYLNFKYNLYDEDKSNEKFYNDLIEKIAEKMNYKSFRLIDTSKSEEIEIKVFCNGENIKTIYINGIEDYFIFMDSKINMKKYKEIPITNINIESSELLNCIENDWNANVDFGSRESIFQKYYIYWDEGIQTRKIKGKIYNIVFTNKYNKNVVNGITTNMENNDIIAKLGKPTFSEDNNKLIGYKSNDIYVFFEKGQISIYRNFKNTDNNEFFKLVDKYLEKETDLLDFMNELTYLWPDYDEYTYSEDSVFLSYPNKGIDIKINYENMSGIILYNNMNSTLKDINKYLENTEFVAQLQEDNVFNAEKRRFSREEEIKEKCIEYKENYEKNDNRNRGNIYDYYMTLSNDEKIMKVYFIPIENNGEYSICELSENIDTYIWCNDYCFIYSINGKGIYFYNLKEQYKGTIVVGEDEFKIKSFENGILRYDNNEVIFQ